jgi:phage head maturation protease
VTTLNDLQRAARPPLADLCRSAPFTQRSSDGEGEADGLTLDGYAAVFNRQTVIDSWEGKFKEQIAPGAMKRSFRESPPRIQFDHGRHVLLGSIPIASNETGYPREEVDAELAPEGGAHVLARMLDNWLVQPVRDAIAAGTIDGMSFRFGVVREAWHDAEGKRITKEEDLMAQLRRTWVEDVPDEELLVRTLQELRVPELGPVVWPAYTDTSVSVRSLTIDLANLSDPEERTKLAQAVILADRAEEDTAQRGTPAPAGAASHPVESSDTQHGTSLDVAGHLSESKRLARASVLAEVRANNLRLSERH